MSNKHDNNPYSFADAVVELSQFQGWRHLLPTAEATQSHLYSSIEALAHYEVQINRLNRQIKEKELTLQLLWRNKMVLEDKGRVTDTAVQVKVDNDLDLSKLRNNLDALRERKVVHQAVNAVLDKEEKRTSPAYTPDPWFILRAYSEQRGGSLSPEQNNNV